jgi:DNA-binding response OmpR family regulator
MKTKEDIGMFKILLVEDEQSIRTLIKTYLNKQGYHVIEAEDGKSGFDVFSNQHVDLIITDLMMPKKDGYDLTQQIRQSSKDIPILIMTALDAFQDKEKGFETGADDYMTKPVNLPEMHLRIKALLRRYQVTKDHQIELEHLKLDFLTFSCSIDGNNISLTKKEFMLLFKLLSNPNIIFTREQLMNEIWGFDSDSYDRTVDTHIKRLREMVMSSDFEIQTVRGLGYKAVIK